LCETLLAREADVLHMTFHSSNIGVGGTPYVPTARDRDAFLDRVESVLSFLVEGHDVQPTTARDYVAQLTSQQADSESVTADEIQLDATTEPILL
jgi:hypothetical protein